MLQTQLFDLFLRTVSLVSRVTNVAILPITLRVQNAEARVGKTASSIHNYGGAGVGISNNGFFCGLGRLCIQGVNCGNCCSDEKEEWVSRGGLLACGEEPCWADNTVSEIVDLKKCI